jgi:hypothetical protein
MIGIDCVAPIQTSNRLQIGVGSERGSALHPLIFIVPRASISADDLRAALIRDEKPLEIRAAPRLFGFSRSRGEKTMTDRKVLALAAPLLRRDVACPALFRQAKRANKHRVSQKTIRRLISEVSCAGATPVECSSS